MTKEYWIYVKMQGCSNMHFAGNCDAETQEEADKYAWEAAVEEYESFAGYHGIPSRDEIEEELREEDPETEIDDEDIECRFNEAVSDHVSYWAVEAQEGIDPDDEEFIESCPWMKGGFDD